MKANAATWKTYKETEEDKKVYSKTYENLYSVIEHEGDSSFGSEKSANGKKNDVQYDIDN